MLLLLWPLAVKKKKLLHLLRHPQLLRHLLLLLLQLTLWHLLLHQPWLKPLLLLLTLLALLPTRLSTLLLTLPKLLPPSNQLLLIQKSHLRVAFLFP